ncbi:MULTISPECIES: carbohydrate ABC transporter permease [Paenibacillus]|jgi:raffinose/stachyose/melibiose transport system permease protein|uniref:ABC transporter permease n=1 Tax=Paenibacillus azoreducens TaxID=116718 RepID=A0A920CUD8_9BACL|nr:MULTISPECIES: sugar ABC transporter permease [Paenibacillus]MBE9914521.1 sugar ABC transporter permease [Paenibacillus donghaensis]GIO49317.1 ABC transporter permease [Paenibacillus azoreducens]
MKRKDKFWFGLFTMPLFIIFTTVVIIPFIIGVAYSFISWDGIASNPKVFVGLDNYVTIFHDERFFSSARHTLEFTLLALVSVNLLGLAFSLLVTNGLRTSKLARTFFFMPNLIGGLILGYIWKFIFTDGFKFLGGKTGLEEIFFNWLISPRFALYALVIVFTWQMAGYTMIIYIAGIQGIPDELLEAAKVDGANWWHRLTKITFPLLMPSFTICLFMTLSGAFKIYDVNLSLTNGGPVHSTEMFAMNIFNEIFGYGRYGVGQAKAILFFLIVALVTLTQVIITKKKEVQM